MWIKIEVGLDRETASTADEDGVIARGRQSQGAGRTSSLRPRRRGELDDGVVGVSLLSPDALESDFRNLGVPWYFDQFGTWSADASDFKILKFENLMIYSSFVALQKQYGG
ncbi:hypothetical protein ACOSQ3_004397 [Xanthoceras sorbifolium]